jgi:hypothetical protein
MPADNCFFAEKHTFPASLCAGKSLAVEQPCGLRDNATLRERYPRAAPLWPQNETLSNYDNRSAANLSVSGINLIARRAGLKSISIPIRTSVHL